MDFIYQILPIFILVLVAVGAVKAFGKKGTTKNTVKTPYSFYNYKILIVSIVLSGIASLGSLQNGAYAVVASFIISLVLWYLIITFCFWVANKLSKKNQF